jgi:flagellar hook-length control protein FliK
LAADATGRESQVLDQFALSAEPAGTAPAPREPGHSSAPAPPPRLAQHLLAADIRESRNFAATGVNQTRFVDRVARALRAAQGREGMLRLRLHPPELGSLRIELRMQNGALSARLEAETTAAQSLLIDHAQMLRDRLVEQGVRIERFEVDLLDQHTPRERGQAFEQHAARENPASAPRAPQSHTPAAAPLETPRPVPAPGRLNVIV